MPQLATALEQPTTEPNSEVAALSDIVNWSESRYAWQRDALRRLCQSAELTQADIAELVEICKGVTDKARPISHDHIRDPEASTKKVELKSIYNVENVNALAADQRLQFSANGVTVVYGDNGSGKSGYTRILKQICRARDPKTATILPNIYGTQTGLLKAQVQFVAAGQNQTTEWIKDQTMERLLSSVSVFDSSTASIHVDVTNDVAYVPFPMALLSNLAEACKSIKNALQAEIDALTAQTPDSIKSPKCQSGTAVGKAIAALKSNTNPQTIETLETLSADDEKRLEQLQSDLANDPAVIIGGLNAKLRRFGVLCDKGNQLSSVIAAEQQVKLKELHGEWLTRKQTAELAATALFKDDPLPNVGGAAWKALWEAARWYSQNGAYVGQEFPVTVDEAHCVLCQQTLDAEAKERLARFESFVTDDTKQQEHRALSNFQQLHGVLSAAPPCLAEISQFVTFCKEELNNADLAKEVRAFFLKGKWRLRALLKLQDALPGTPVWPKAISDNEKTQIVKRVSDLTVGDASLARQKLAAERAELEDRKWLGVVKNDVIAEIERKKKIDALNGLIKQETSTTQITAKSTSISENLVTNALRAQFAQEVDKMKLAGLAVELKQERSSYGVPQFKVSLTRNPSAKVGQVLSEGEFRCIALAAFLAELTTTQSKSAIVFDDPVSSLDHMHREAVAERLATESLTRQVIVFTHDIHFLFLLGQFCRENGAEIQYRHVTKRPDATATGLCYNDAPPKAQDVAKRIDALANRLNNEKIHYENGNETEWYRTVRSLQDDIRFTWERAVEDFVGEVVSRFRNKVETKGLARLTVLTLEDCQVMRDAYGRCSSWLHSSGVGLNSTLPSADDIQKEIGVLKSWYDVLRQKQKSVAAT
jgi:energy-coupling factor transporter ATP-binding protein EcfA2